MDLKINISGNATMKGQSVSLGRCPQCRTCDVVSRSLGGYRVPDMFPTEDGRCLSCNYVILPLPEGYEQKYVAEHIRYGHGTISTPFLVDRADGVKGHFSVGQLRDNSVIRFWSVKNQRWDGYADFVPLTKERAEEIVQAHTQDLRAMLS